MTTIVVGQAVQACLGPLTDQTELRGADGTLLGYFVPVPEATAQMYEEAQGRFDPNLIRQRAAHQRPKWLGDWSPLNELQYQEFAE